MNLITRTLLFAFAFAITVACATLPPRNALELGYKTVTAHMSVTAQQLDRGTLEPAQGARRIAAAEALKGKLDAAGAALALCKPEVPCTGYASLMQSLQPSLLELERELREAEKARPGAKP
jgi:hypothetical protein